MDESTKASLVIWRHHAGEYNRYVNTAILLADAYAAEHPPDDDEPLTEEWFRSVGAVDIKWPTGLAIIITSTMYLYLSINGALLSGHLQKRYRTRGEVRRLCAALGNPLKEDGK